MAMPAAISQLDMDIQKTSKLKAWAVQQLTREVEKDEADHHHEDSLCVEEGEGGVPTLQPPPGSIKNAGRFRLVETLQHGSRFVRRDIHFESEFCTDEMLQGDWAGGEQHGHVVRCSKALGLKALRQYLMSTMGLSNTFIRVREVTSTTKTLEIVPFCIWIVHPFCDPRLHEEVPLYRGAMEGVMESRTLIGNQADWDFILLDRCPMDTVRLRQMTVTLMTRKIREGGRSDRLAGSHALWELAVNKDHHREFSSDALGSLVFMLGLEDDSAGDADAWDCSPAVGALWSLAVTQSLRHQLVGLGAIERLVGMAARLLRVIVGDGSGKSGAKGASEAAPAVPEGASEAEGPDAERKDDASSPAGTGTNPPPSLRPASTHFDKRSRKPEAPAKELETKLLGYAVGALSVLACDDVGRQRLLHPNDETPGLDPLTWCLVLTECAEGAPGVVGPLGRPTCEIAAEVLCGVLCRDFSSQRVGLEVVPRLAKMVVGHSNARVRLCSAVSLAGYIKSDAGRTLLRDAGAPEVGHILSTLLDVCNEMPGKVAAATAGLTPTELLITEAASTCVWGLAQALASAVDPAEAGQEQEIPWVRALLLKVVRFAVEHAGSAARLPLGDVPASSLGEAGGGAGHPALAGSMVSSGGSGVPAYSRKYVASSLAPGVAQEVEESLAAGIEAAAGGLPLGGQGSGGEAQAAGGADVGRKGRLPHDSVDELPPPIRKARAMVLRAFLSALSSISAAPAWAAHLMRITTVPRRDMPPEELAARASWEKDTAYLLPAALAVMLGQVSPQGEVIPGARVAMRSSAVGIVGRIVQHHFPPSTGAGGVNEGVHDAPPPMSEADQHHQRFMYGPHRRALIPTMDALLSTAEADPGNWHLQAGAAAAIMYLSSVPAHWAPWQMDGLVDMMYRAHEEVTTGSIKRAAAGGKGGATDEQCVAVELYAVAAIWCQARGAPSLTVQSGALHVLVAIAGPLTTELRTMQRHKLQQAEAARAAQASPLRTPRVSAAASALGGTLPRGLGDDARFERRLKLLELILGTLWRIMRDNSTWAMVQADYQWREKSRDARAEATRRSANQSGGCTPTSPDGQPRVPGPGPGGAEGSARKRGFTREMFMQHEQGHPREVPLLELLASVVASVRALSSPGGEEGGPGGAGEQLEVVQQIALALLNMLAAEVPSFGIRAVQLQVGPDLIHMAKLAGGPTPIRADAANLLFRLAGRGPATIRASPHATGPMTGVAASLLDKHGLVREERDVDPAEVVARSKEAAGEMSDLRLQHVEAAGGGYNWLEELQAGGGVREEVVVSLLESGHPALEGLGARSCAHIAVWDETKAALLQAGAVQQLLQLASRCLGELPRGPEGGWGAWAEQVRPSEPGARRLSWGGPLVSLRLALQALLNLSSYPACVRTIARTQEALFLLVGARKLAAPAALAAAELQEASAWGGGFSCGIHTPGGEGDTGRFTDHISHFALRTPEGEDAPGTAPWGLSSVPPATPPSRAEAAWRGAGGEGAMAGAEVEWAQIYVLAGGILQNTASHPENRVALYKVELETRAAGQAAASLQAEARRRGKDGRVKAEPLASQGGGTWRAGNYSIPIDLFGGKGDSRPSTTQGFGRRGDSRGSTAQSHVRRGGRAGAQGGGYEDAAASWGWGGGGTLSSPPSSPRGGEWASAGGAATWRETGLSRPSPPRSRPATLQSRLRTPRRGMWEPFAGAKEVAKAARGAGGPAPTPFRQMAHHASAGPWAAAGATGCSGSLSDRAPGRSLRTPGGLGSTGRTAVSSVHPNTDPAEPFSPWAPTILGYKGRPSAGYLKHAGYVVQLGAPRGRNLVKFPEEDGSGRVKHLNPEGRRKHAAMMAIVERAPERRAAAFGSTVRFHTSVQVQQAIDATRPRGPAPDLHRHEHREGAAICQGLQDAYHLPDGRVVHYYQSHKAVVDEVDVALAAAVSPLSTRVDSLLWGALPAPAEILGILGMDKIADFSGKRVVAGVGELPEQFRPRPVLAPQPCKHTLDIPSHDCDAERDGFCNMHGVLQPRRPLFVCGGALSHMATRTWTIPNIPGRGFATQLDLPEEASGWSLETSSVFEPRRHECDAKSFWRTPRVEEQMFEIDWAQLAAKGRLQRLVNGEAALQDLKGAMRLTYGTFLRLFEYFAAVGNPNMWSAGAFVQLGEWWDMVIGLRIADNASKLSRKVDCDRVFIAANLEAGDKQAEANDANPDHCLLRFEFLEAMVRLAQNKYGKASGSGVTTHLATAYLLLQDLHVRPFLAPTAREGPLACFYEHEEAAGRAKAKAEAGSGPATPRIKEKEKETASFSSTHLVTHESVGGPGAEPIITLRIGETPAPPPLPEGVSSAARAVRGELKVEGHRFEGAFQDPNLFRLQHLYSEEVDAYLHSELPFLRALFEFYRVQEGKNVALVGKRLQVPYWMALLADAHLAPGEITGGDVQNASSSVQHGGDAREDDRAMSRQRRRLMKVQKSTHVQYTASALRPTPPSRSGEVSATAASSRPGTGSSRPRTGRSAGSSRPASGGRGVEGAPAGAAQTAEGGKGSAESAGYMDRGFQPPVSKHDAQLCFFRARTDVVDDLYARRRVTTLTLTDFLEAVGRLAHALSPPPEVEVAVYLAELRAADPEFFQYYFAEGLAGDDELPEGGARQDHTFVYYKAVGFGKPALAEARGLAPEAVEAWRERPLLAKLSQLVQVLAGELADMFNVPVEEAEPAHWKGELTRRINEGAKRVAGLKAMRNGGTGVMI